MLGGLGLSGRTFMNSGAGEYSDHHHDTLLLISSKQLLRLSSSLSYSISLQLNNHNLRFRSKSPVSISCLSRSFHYLDDDDYLEASVLITGCLHDIVLRRGQQKLKDIPGRRSYEMRIQGYQEAIKWMPTGKLFPLSGQEKGPRTNIPTVGPELLSQFRSPTIFLKISCDCDEDYLLPILVGESAVERLISSSLEDEGFPNQFQLARNITGKLGYEVKLVQITERVDNIYIANICFHKRGTEDIITVDARPSDAINVAKRCRAPIYVSKQIVLTDAIKIVYKTGKLRDRKPVYDVLLDSAIDGPDVLAEELDLVSKMNLAVKEERYSDAAIWRDKLLRIRSSENE